MLEIVRYSEFLQSDWEKVNQNSVNGTFLSSRQFLNYHPPKRFIDHSLVVKDHNDIVAIVPGCEINEEGEKKLISHQGSTYGGIIFRENPGVSDACEILEAMEAYLTDNFFKSIILKQPPFIFHSIPTQTIDFVLIYKGFIVEKIELTTTIDLSFYDNEGDILAHCNSKTRNQCRLGYKNSLKFEETKEYESFYWMLVEGLKRHSVLPTHSVEEMKFLTETLPHNIELYSVIHGDKIIAGCWVFKFEKRVFHTQYLAMNYDYKNYAPMNFLILKLIGEAIKNGFKYFNFGISTERGGKQINSSLFKFKEGFGGAGIVLNTYRKNFN